MENEENLEELSSDTTDALAKRESEIAPVDSQETEITTNNASELQQRHEVESRFSYREGPIPDPETLQEYNAVVPGFAQEFLASFLEESKHRRKLESRQMQLEEDSLQLQGKLIVGNQRRSNWGLAAGFIVSMTALAIGGGLVYTGHGLEGSLIAGTILPSLAAVFVTGTLKKNKQEEGENDTAEVDDQ